MGQPPLRDDKPMSLGGRDLKGRTEREREREREQSPAAAHARDLS
jgi:hypothetical protein